MRGHPLDALRKGKMNITLKIKIPVILFLLLLIISCSNNEPPSKEPPTKAYVLKKDEGEKLFSADSSEGLLIIKASQEMGTQGSILIYDEMPNGSTSGIHYHSHADELFYVIEGSGFVLIDNVETKIEKGDVIVVPAGQDHKITSSQENKLVVTYFLDKPGLDKQFRVEDSLKINKSDMTLEELNNITRKYGTVYKSIK